MEQNTNGISFHRTSVGAPYVANTPLFDEPSEWSEIITLTPAIAQQWLNDFKFSGQRKHDENHSDFLANEMLSNNFRISEMRHIHTPRHTWQTDGQHRCYGCIKSGVPIRISLLHIRGTDSDAAKDYQSTDINKVRTVRERLNVDDIDWRKTVTADQFTHLHSAVAPIIGGFTAGSFGGKDPIVKSLGERIVAMEEWLPEAKMLYEMTHGAGEVAQYITRRRSVLAICLITLRYQPEKAKEFWSGIVQDDRLAKGDPRKTTLKFLETTHANKIKAPLYPRYVAAGWNAWIRGEKVAFLRVPNSTKPIQLLGTPYNGKDVLDYVPSRKLKTAE